MNPAVNAADPHDIKCEFGNVPSPSSTKRMIAMMKQMLAYN